MNEKVIEGFGNAINQPLLQRLSDWCFLDS